MAQVVRTAHNNGDIVVCGFDSMVTVSITPKVEWKGKVHISIFPKEDGNNTVLNGYYPKSGDKPTVRSYHDKSDYWVDAYVASHMQAVK